MKIMNAVYKPLRVAVPSDKKIIIFWSSTEDEISTRLRPGNGGVWNPNHFVPLLQKHQITLRKTNNEQTVAMPNVKANTRLYRIEKQIELFSRVRINRL